MWSHVGNGAALSVCTSPPVTCSNMPLHFSLILMRGEMRHTDVPPRHNQHHMFPSLPQCRGGLLHRHLSLLGHLPRKVVLEQLQTVVEPFMVGSPLSLNPSHMALPTLWHETSLQETSHKVCTQRLRHCTTQGVKSILPEPAPGGGDHVWEEPVLPQVHCNPQRVMGCLGCKRVVSGFRV